MKKNLQNNNKWKQDKSRKPQDRGLEGPIEDVEKHRRMLSVRHEFMLTKTILNISVQSIVHCKSKAKSTKSSQKEKNTVKDNIHLKRKIPLIKYITTAAKPKFVVVV